MACEYAPPLQPDQGRLGSRFGVRPGIQPPHLPTFHAGIDLLTPGRPQGTTPVYAVGAAYVERLPSNDVVRGAFAGYGNAVVLRHFGRDRGFWTFYCHLQRHAPYMAVFLERGLVLPAGAIVGWVGATTNGKFPGMGAHLHFEVRRAKADGSSPLPGPYRTYNVDPVPWLAARGIRFGSAFNRGAIVVEPPEACPAAIALSDAKVRAALGGQDPRTLA